jgi:hypothetical protein
MGAYYGGAVMTIAACWAESQADGFSIKRIPLERTIKVPLWSTSLTETGSFYIRTKPKGLHYDMTKSSLSCRGWTLQERMLSRRVICFGQDQLSWECSESVRHEENDDVPIVGLGRRFGKLELENALKSSHSDTRIRVQAIMSEWIRVVDKYSKRILTVPTDILPALSGIAHCIADKTGFLYKAGIWLEEVWNGLLWETRLEQGYVDSGQIQSRPKEYLAPSWSWASLGPRRFFYSEVESFSLKRLHSTPELVSCNIDLATTDVFGAVTSGSIVIKGLVLDFHHSGIEYDRYGLAFHCQDINILWDEPSLVLENVFLLQIGQERLRVERHEPFMGDCCRFLALQQLGHADEDTYKRIGIGVFITGTEIDERD